MTRIGLLGGTFDPIHYGHLDVADAARRALRLERIWLVPARVPPHRREPQAPAAHRFAMAALAVQRRPELAVSDIEMEDRNPSYTSATLDRLASAGIDTKSLFLVTGADAFREIETWLGYPLLLDRCHFVVVSRPGQPSTEMPALLPQLSSRMRLMPADIPETPGVFLVDAPTAPVSSTGIRRRLQSGESIESMVPPEVAAYIARQRLYRTPAAKDFA